MKKCICHRRMLISFLFVLWLSHSGEIFADDPVEIVIWAEPYTLSTMERDPEGSGQYGLYLKEQFEREHPGVIVTLEHQGWDESLRQNLMNSLLIGAAPDAVVGENYFQQYAEKGAVFPLNEKVTDVIDDVLPITYQTAVHNDTIYGLPAFTGVFGFERNCQVVEKAGLDCEKPPKTWDELLEHVKFITERGKGDYYGYTLQGPAETSVGAAFRIAVYLAQVDAPFCQNECSTPYFNNPRAIPVMEFIRKLNKYTPPGLTFNPDEGQVYAALFQGHSAYQIAGSWHPVWSKASGCEDCRYSPIPVPKDGHTANIIVGNTIYAALDQSEHADLAAEWVKFLVRQDVQELAYSALGRLPVTRSALMAVRPSMDPALHIFVDELLHNPHLGVLPQWNTKPNDLWRIYNKMLTEVLTTDRPVQEIMDDAQQKAEEVLQ